MWFKHCQVFSLVEGFDYEPEALETQLAEWTFRPCNSVEAASVGWVAPSGEADGPLVHAANGFLMICLRIEEKIIPASVLNEMVQEKVDALEHQSGRKLRKKDRDGVKDEVYHTLLPRAFSKSTRIHAYIDTQLGLLVVNSSGRNKAEFLTEHLRRALGSLKVELPKLQSVSMLMTDWVVSEQYPAEFVIQDGCVLQDSTEGGSIRCAKQNILSDEIRALVDSGREVVQLNLSWCDQIAFTLTEDFAVKSMKFLEVVQDQAKDVLTETDQERFDADFSIMTETLRGFLKQLLAEFAAKEDHDDVEEASETSAETEAAVSA